MEIRKLALLTSLLLIAALASAHAAEWGRDLKFQRCFHPESCTWDREVLRFTLHPGDVRAEAQDPEHVPYGKPASYHFVFRLPRDFHLTDDTNAMVLAQFHADNDQHPPVALRLWGDRLAVTIHHRTTPGHETEEPEEVVPYLAPISFGLWHSFEVTVRSGEAGVLHVWMDGREIVSYAGPIGYNGKANYMKIGLYDSSNTLKEDCHLDYAWFQRN